jgi:hypothetical protein
LKEVSKQIGEKNNFDLTVLKGVTCVTFEVLTAVVIKSTIFWDITPPSSA